MSPSRSRRSFFGRLFGLFLIALGALILLIIPAWLSRPTPAIANPTGMATFKNRYPGVTGTKLDSCTTCHTAAIPATNPFGAAYLANGRNDGALATMEPTDTDGDGWTNLLEIQNLTFPGDAADHPAGSPPTNTPTPTPTNTTTATVTSTPTNTATPTLTSTPSDTPTSTNTPTTTGTPTDTATPTETPTVTTTAAAPTDTPTVTATAAESSTPTATSMVSPTPTATGTLTVGFPGQSIFLPIVDRP